MTLDVMVDLITSVGFPIFVAVVMIDQNKKTTEGYKELYRELRKTIESNTTIIDELVRELRG